MDQVRCSELLPLESIGRAEVVAGITKETTTLSQTATVLVIGAQAAVLIFFTSIYIAYLSLPAFALSVAIIFIAASLFLSRAQRLKAETHEALQWENRLFDRLTDLLDGFKEIRLNSRRSDDLFDDTMAVSTTAAELKIKTQTDGLKQFVFSQASFYVVLGAIVFVAPTLSQSLGDSMGKTVTALLFIIGAITSVVQAIPLLRAANAAAENIEALEGRLKGAGELTPRAESGRTAQFSQIELRRVIFDYKDRFSDTSFEVGPIDFIVRPGELILILGGNGSGKSTLLKLLVGLYQPNLGEIRLDGQYVTAATRNDYRELFTAIFSDYHLFKRLYGISSPNVEEINTLLAQFDLLGKTRVADGEFGNLELSAGQRKRLAMVVALLEKRPVLVLDEWTADQDPEFRRKFYHQLLPELQRSGRTIVAVTHDERYIRELTFPARIIRMEEGRVAEDYMLPQAS
jgi:putative ATP-binding cassette transporter